MGLLRGKDEGRAKRDDNPVASVEKILSLGPYEPPSRRPKSSPKLWFHTTRGNRGMSCGRSPLHLRPIIVSPPRLFVCIASRKRSTGSHHAAIRPHSRCITSGMSCREKWRDPCSSSCKGSDTFDCQLHPIVRRRRVSSCDSEQLAPPRQSRLLCARYGFECYSILRLRPTHRILPREPIARPLR